MSDNEKSLSDEATFAGGMQPDEKELQSLGDRSTLGGSDGSSISDLGSIGDLPDHDMEIVDLSKRYRIEKSLGKGGMGEVLLATDTRLDRQVAIKRIRADIALGKTAAARFLQEAKAVAALNHNNVVSIHDYGRDADGPFLIMEYVSGGSLLQRCKEGPIELEQAVDLACQLCDGLGRAHDAGIIHRDIKPANILLTHDGVPKLTDFGLAKADSRDHTMTMAGAVLGTLDFMPPEQRRDAALTDSRSDLWSLAASLYQMVTGESPKVIRLKRVPEQIRDVLDKALEESKDERFQAPLELRDALRDAIDKDARSRGVALENLDEGQCLSCGSRNPSSRKFCKECAASLMVSCLKCEESIPVWEKICGECGCVQEEILEQRREAMKARRNGAEECLQDLDFDGARTIATEIQNEPDLRLSQLKSWSSAFLEEINATWEQEKQRASDLLSEAIKHESAKDYGAGIRTLNQIAEVFRNQSLLGHHETVCKLKHRIESKQNDLMVLERQVKQKIKQRQLDGLMVDVDTLIELAPNREDFRKLKDQLFAREEKITRKIAESCAQAEELIAAGNPRAAYKLLEKVDSKRLTQSQAELNENLSGLVASEDSLISAVRAAKADGVIELHEIDSLLPKVNEFLTSIPNHASVLRLQSELNERREHLIEERASFYAKAQRNRNRCEFQQAIENLQGIPKCLMDTQVQSLLDNCRYLGHLQSEALDWLESAEKSGEFAPALKMAASYRSLLANSKELEDESFLAIYERCHRILEQQQKAEQRAIAKRAQRRAILAGTTVLLILSSGLVWRFVKSRNVFLAETRAIELVSVYKSKVDVPNRNAAMASIVDLESLNSQSSVLANLKAKMRAISIAAAESDAKEMVSVYESNPNDTNRNAAEESLWALEFLTTQSTVLVSLQSKMKSIEIGLAESRATDMVSVYEADPDDTNRTTATASLLALEGLSRQSPVLISLRAKMQSIPIAAAESDAKEMVSVYESNPNETNRAAASASLLALEGLSRQSPVLTSLRAKMQSIAIQDAELTARELVSSYKQDSSQVNLDEAMSALLDLEKLDPDSFELRQLRSTLQSMVETQAESDAETVIAAYDQDPSDTNLRKAVSALNSAEDLVADPNKPSLATLRSRIGTVLMRSIQAFETNRSDENLQSAMKASSQLDSLLKDSSIFANANDRIVKALVTRLGEIPLDRVIDEIDLLQVLNADRNTRESANRLVGSRLVERFRGSLGTSDYNSAGKYFAAITKLNADAANQLSSDWLKIPKQDYGSIPPSVLSNVPDSVLSNLPPSVIIQLPPITNSIGIELKWIPAGSFMMSEVETIRDVRSEVHQVTLTQTFMLGVYEVTQEQFEQLMGSNPSRFKAPQNPVEHVNWDAAIEFCQKLSALPEERAAGRVYRLPTEAEWEYACRAGTTTRYGFGDPDFDLGDYAWHSKNSNRQTHPVGRKQSNAWGLYDMHGNVWEWCADRYGKYPSGSVTDPKGPESGLDRVCRGGSFDDRASHLTSSVRRWSLPLLGNSTLGFRVVCVTTGQ